MGTYIKRDNQVEGPFTEAEIRRRMEGGLVTSETPAWRMGMAEWTTLGRLLPDKPAAPPPIVPPVLPAPTRAGVSATAEQPPSSEELAEAMAMVNALLDSSPPAPEPEALNRLESLAGEFLAPLGNRLAVANWQRRGLKISGSVRFSPGALDNRIYFAAERDRNGGAEVYAHDFLNDMLGAQLQPPKMFPSLHGTYYAMQSLSLPSPEYLHLYGAFLMQSGLSQGNWPRGQKAGGLEIRNLAARCLMVYRQAPRTPLEAQHYKQALHSWDYPDAAASMSKYQAKLERVEATPDWREQAEGERRHWLEGIVTPGGLRCQAENDPEFIALSKVPPERIDELIAGSQNLLRRFPDDYVLKVFQASFLMRGPDPKGGEARLRELIRQPADRFEGHSRLGTLLKYQGRREEALAVYEDALRRWPWYNQAVDACMWILTEGTVSESVSP